MTNEQLNITVEDYKQMSYDEFIAQLDLKDVKIERRDTNEFYTDYSSPYAVYTKKGHYLLDDNQRYFYKDYKSAARCYFYKINKGMTKRIYQTAYDSYLEESKSYTAISTALF